MSCDCNQTCTILVKELVPQCTQYCIEDANGVQWQVLHNIDDAVTTYYDSGTGEPGVPTEPLVPCGGKPAGLMGCTSYLVEDADGIVWIAVHDLATGETAYLDQATGVLGVPADPITGNC